MAATQLAIYSETDGGFIRSVFCEPSLISLQATAGELAVEDPRGFVELQNTYLDVSTRQVVDMPTKPGEWYRFNHQTKQWVADNEDAAFEVKRTRQILLQQSDWTDTASAPERLGQALYGQWQTYRQALRDVTKQAGYPFVIMWPVAPT